MQNSITTKPRSRAGLTLIELLVVIAIIAILIAVIQASLGSARGGAAGVKCQANLRQWAYAANMYALGNEGCLPRRGQGAQETNKIDRDADWFNALPPLLGLESYAELVAADRKPRPNNTSIWICPRPASIARNYYFSYGMNMGLSTWADPSPDRIDRVAPVDRQVFMADAPGSFCSIIPSDKPFSAAAPHRGTINIAFLDGHVARFSGQYVGCGTGDPQRSDIRWRVPGSIWEGPGE